MTTITVTPSSATLAPGGTVDVTVAVTGAPAGTVGTATFPIDIGGVVANGTVAITLPAPVPVHATPTLSASIVGMVTVTRLSLAADGLTAVYRIARP